MNFIRNRLITEETYFTVIAACTGIGTIRGMYNELKNTRYGSNESDKIFIIAEEGCFGAAAGCIAGATSPVWIPIVTVFTGFYAVATGFYAVDSMYKKIF